MGVAAAMYTNDCRKAEYDLLFDWTKYEQDGSMSWSMHNDGMDVTHGSLSSSEVRGLLNEDKEQQVENLISEIDMMSDEDFAEKYKELQKDKDDDVAHEVVNFLLW